jgi:Domain of unknown function (DUF4832)/Domain of unknown function (DUF4874)
MAISTTNKSPIMFRNQPIPLNQHISFLCSLGLVAIGLMSCASKELPDRASVPLPIPTDRIGSIVATQLVANSSSIVTYQPTAADFLNPERGFHENIELMKERDLSMLRSRGFTLVRSYILLDEYRNRPLPAAVLNRLNQQLQLLRSAGIKIILRFSYNFPTTDTDKAPDVKLDLALKHIQQLKPILQNNADVIAVLQAGFIGAWGEWHSSANQLDQPAPKAKILAGLLAALPSSRIVQIRYPADIQANYPQPLTAQAAFRGTPWSRVGLHNDCFLADPTDAGTYRPNLQPLRKYLGQIAPFTSVGGETCGIRPAEDRGDCATAEADLAQFHWSYLNIKGHQPTLDRWAADGCFPTISRKLGYRIQLIRSSFPSQMRKGSKLNGNFVVKNVGYASPFNPRGLELILRHQQTGKKYRIPLLKAFSPTHDPRFWLPQAGEISVKVTGEISKNIPVGMYEILLNLPDPMPKLANRPDYSIRLANEQTWESQTGFNQLKRTIQVKK